MKPLMFHFEFRVGADGGLLGLSLPGGKPERFCHLWPERASHRSAWTALPAVVRDLIDLVQVVFAVDRVCSRRPDTEGHGWSRILRVKVPVRNRGFWNRKPLTDQLLRTLNFLTSDDWSFQWEARHSEEAPSSRPALLSVDAPPTTFMLHSGGLDGLAGACHQLLSVSQTRCGLVSVGTSDRAARIQETVASAITERFPGRAYPVPLRIRIARPVRGRGLHRTRSFVFQALGAVEAYGAGSNELLQCENGTASLTLSPVPKAFSWETSKGVHPRFLSEMSTLLSMVFDSTFDIRNPHLFQTKAEMCGAIREAGLVEAIRATTSCEFFPQRLTQKSACGKCGPCLLRRQSLFASGLSCFDSSGGYRYDVRSAETRIPGDGRVQLDAMQCQRERFRVALGAADQWGGLVQAYPEIENTAHSCARLARVSYDEARLAITHMLARYVEEWESFYIPSSHPDVAGTSDRRFVRVEVPEAQLALPVHAHTTERE
jgi:hypothetical protein